MLDRNRLVLLLMPALLFLATSARAELIVRAQSVDAVAGSTGNAFEVVLENTGPDAVALDAFSFGLSVDPAIDFTGATTGTTSAPYIFAGASLFGPDIATSTGSVLTASDLFDVPGGSVIVGAGATVGLGRVVFDVAATASGSYAITFLGSPDTSLALGGTDVPIDALEGGTIRVTGDTAVIPEPGSAVLAACGLGVLVAARCLRGGGGAGRARPAGSP